MAADMLALRPQLKPGEARVGSLFGLSELLSEFNVEPGPLLERCGLSEAYLRNPDNTTRFANVGSLLQACVEVTGCAHFGLLTGMRSRISALGVSGFLAGTAPSVETALNELITNYDLHNRAATPFLNIESNRALFGFEVFERNIPALDQIHDGALAIAYNILSTMFGPGWKPLGVSFRRDVPADLVLYKRFFRVPLSFNAEVNAIAFPARDLQASVSSADPLVRHYFQQHVAAIRQRANLSFREEAQRALVLLLAANDCTQEQLALRLAIHPRTLNRRLKEAGTSYREMRDTVRHTLACQMLRDGRASIESIASALGFSAVSSFNRAFSSWEGKPPAAWRKIRENAEA